MRVRVEFNYSELTDNGKRKHSSGSIVNLDVIRPGAPFIVGEKFSSHYGEGETLRGAILDYLKQDTASDAIQSANRT